MYLKGQKNNIQNILTKESIYTALMILMSEKQFSEISITELTNKAGVSRMAFYRNYSIKEDIIIEYIDEAFIQYRDELLKEKLTIYRVSLIFFLYAKKHKKLIGNLINSKIEYIIFDRYDIYLTQLFKNFVRVKLSQKEKYILEFVSGGLSKIIIAWIKNDLRESEEEMAGIITTLAQHTGL